MAIRTEIGGFQGEDITIPYKIIDATGAPVDTSDKQFAFAAKLRFAPAGAADAAAISKDEGGGAITHTDDVAGEGTVQLTRAETALLSPGVYEWELRRVDGANNVVEAYGSLYVRRSILIEDVGS